MAGFEPATSRVSSEVTLVFTTGRLLFLLHSRTSILAGERSKRVRGRSFQLPCASGLRPRRWNSAPRQGPLPCLVSLSEVTLFFHHRRNSPAFCESRHACLSIDSFRRTHVRICGDELLFSPPRTFFAGGGSPRYTCTFGQGTGDHGRACAP